MAVGGYDERFQLRWGWDDFDLQERLQILGVGLISEPKIVSIHLYHGQTGDGDISANHNEVLCRDKQKPMVANQGKEWGKLRRRK